MIDINLIRENPELVKKNIKKKFQDNKLHLVDEVKEKDSEWRKLKGELDSLRHERNTISEKINLAKKMNQDISVIVKKAKELPVRIAEMEQKTIQLETEIKKIMFTIPNIIHESVPIGKDASENVVRKVVGKPKKVKYEIFHHGELGEKNNWVDFDVAREISGNGFYYLMGDLAQLSSAMISFARDFMIKQKFEYVEPPLMIHKKVVEGVMAFTEMEIMMYKIENEDLYLIGTSEHSIIGMFIDKTLEKKNLPYAITAFSPCFRKEVGAHGIDEKGLYRVHQFYKQEMVVVCEPLDSYKWYDKMLQYTLDVFRALEIPVRVLECCSGDLGDLKAKSCDVEAWSPKQEKYFEVGSLTNMEEAQARRLNIKVEDKGERYFAHTLNNTVLATPRALIALMENHQLKDGSIRIPKILWNYMGGKKVIRAKAEKNEKVNTKNIKTNLKNKENKKKLKKGGGKKNGKFGKRKHSRFA